MVWVEVGTQVQILKEIDSSLEAQLRHLKMDYYSQLLLLRMFLLTRGKGPKVIKLYLALLLKLLLIKLQLLQILSVVLISILNSLKYDQLHLLSQWIMRDNLDMEVWELQIKLLDLCFLQVQVESLRQIGMQSRIDLDLLMRTRWDIIPIIE